MSKHQDFSTPQYDLALVKELVRIGKCSVTAQARQDAGNIGMIFDDIISTLLCLDAREFYKSMEAEKKPGTFQDVYRTSFNGIPLYYKIQIDSYIEEIVIIISCKEL